MDLADDLLNLKSIALFGVFLRWTISFFPYSGAGKPPLYGDYEAQRHWQEITTNLPPIKWYTNSTDNNLMYWGLDYPPLTAYHSYMIGVIGGLINESYVALHQSRGYESYQHKLFMRSSVLITDVLIYFSSSLFIFYSLRPKQKEGLISFAALLMYPGLYLIDYGHFQYNNISLGLFLLAVGCLQQNRDCLGSICFSLSLNYKQMELYHALPFFFYLLGRCLKEKNTTKCFIKLLKIGICVTLVFFILWLPFLTDVDSILAVVRRIFPIARGLFEDKVASVWCSLSVFIKFKHIFDNSMMALICLISTLILVLPTNLYLLFKPTLSVFKYALVNSSLVFFLFSFHVHEKSILLAVIPACLLYYEHRLMVSWFFFVSLLSMVPLLIKDGLLMPTISLSFLTLLTLCIPSSFKDNLPFFSRKFYIKCLSVSAVCLFSIVLFGLILPPPLRYPDLFPVVLSIICCSHFCFFTFYFHYCQFFKLKKT